MAIVEVLIPGLPGPPGPAMTIAGPAVAGRITGTGVLERIALGAGLAIVDGALTVTAVGTGTVTSVGLSVPTGFSVAGSPVTGGGTLVITFAAGYSLPPTASQSNWDTAYAERLRWDGGSGGLNASTARNSLGLGTAALAASGDFAAAGAPVAAVASHEAAADPHPQYLTPAEGNAAYATAAQGALADTAIQPGNAALSDAREWTAPTVTQVEAQAGGGTDRRAWTVERVWQAAAGWWQSYSSSVGRALATAVDSAAARSALGLGTAATTAASSYASAAQGALADTAVQPAGLSSYLTSTTAASTYQPLDADLTSIAALTTTSFGRSLLTQADAAAARSAIGAGTSSVVISASAAQSLGATAAAGSSGQAADAGHVHQFQGTDICIPLTGESNYLTVSTLLTIGYWPRATVLTAIPIWMLNTAPTGAAAQFDIRVGGTSIFATLPTIDATKTNSPASAAPAVFAAAFISGGQVIAQGANVTLHCTQIGSTVAGAGLKVVLPSRRNA